MQTLVAILIACSVLLQPLTAGGPCGCVTLHHDGGDACCAPAEPTPPAAGNAHASCCVMPDFDNNNGDQRHDRSDHSDKSPADESTGTDRDCGCLLACCVGTAAAWIPLPMTPLAVPAPQDALRERSTGTRTAARLRGLLRPPISNARV